MNTTFPLAGKWAMGFFPLPRSLGDTQRRGRQPGDLAMVQSLSQALVVGANEDAPAPLGWGCPWPCTIRPHCRPGNCPGRAGSCHTCFPGRLWVLPCAVPASRCPQPPPPPPSYLAPYPTSLPGVQRGQTAPAPHPRSPWGAVCAGQGSSRPGPSSLHPAGCPFPA